MAKTALYRRVGRLQCCIAIYKGNSMPNRDFNVRDKKTRTVPGWTAKKSFRGMFVDSSRLRRKRPLRWCVAHVECPNQRSSHAVSARQSLEEVCEDVLVCAPVRGMWFVSMPSWCVEWLRGLQPSAPGRLLGRGAAHVLTIRSLYNDKCRKWCRKMPLTMDSVTEK